MNRSKVLNVTMTLDQALKLGIVFCGNCGHPPNNHFMDQPGKPCAHCPCKHYKQEIVLPK